MAAVDPYELLGVDAAASDEEIKRAYRRQAMRYHPDRNPGDARAEERFKRINEAYHLLCDPVARRRLDLSRRGGGGGGFGAWVGDLFNASRRPRPPQRGRDISYEVEVELCDLLHGLDTTVEVLTRGQYQDERIDESRYATTPLQVRIPEGAHDGQRLRHPGRGEPGLHGGPPGDLHVIVRVRPHPLLSVDGATLHCALPLRLTQLALGARVSVPTVEGTVRMRIPPGTQSGKQFRLRGHGLPDPLTRVRGDQIVEVVAETPCALTADQERLLRELDALCDDDAEHPARLRFLETMRRLHGG